MKMNMQEKVKAQGLNYEWFIEESESITRELKQGKTGYLSETYIREKIMNVLSLFDEDENNG